MVLFPPLQRGPQATYDRVRKGVFRSTRALLPLEKTQPLRQRKISPAGMRKHGMRKTAQHVAESIRVLCGKYSSTLRRVLHGTAEVSFPPAGRNFFIWLKFVYAWFLELPPECAYFAAIERPSHPHAAKKETRMKELVKRLRAVLATASLLGLSPSCTTPPTQ